VVPEPHARFRGALIFGPAASGDVPESLVLEAEDGRIVDSGIMKTRAVSAGCSNDSADNGSAGAVWVTADADPAAAAALSHDLKVPQAVAKTLVSRGYADAGSAAAFLNPRLSSLSDPFLISGLEAASGLLTDAVRAGKRICVFGDYDADGLTATALLSRVLRSLGGEVSAFLPTRHGDGYGLTVTALERCIREHRPELLVTVDCGITAHPAAALARKAGVGLVISDHHEPGGHPVTAEAVVNPKLGAPAAAADLAGVGVAFKLCHGILKCARGAGWNPGGGVPDLRDFLDLVAVGTVADVAPLTGENRIMVRHGLAKLNASKAACWSALRTVSGADGALDTYHVAFTIAPRLNAAGRMESAYPALHLLLADDPAEAIELARALDDANEARKEVEEQMLEEACAELDAAGLAGVLGIVVGKEGWHAGTAGIVAARLARRYGRPATVVAIDPDTKIGRGSCRSAADMDLIAALDACSDLLENYGGHKTAAGVTVPAGGLAGLRERFAGACGRLLAGRDLRRRLRIDAWIGPDEAGEALLRGVEEMAPFGEKNPAPVWGLRGAVVLGEPRTVGTCHLKMRIGAGAAVLPAIGFRMGGREVPAGPLDFAFELKENVFRGAREIQAQLKDFRASSACPHQTGQADCCTCS